MRSGSTAASDPNFGIYGNQWYFANINGTWYGGPGEWLYRGAATCKAGQGTNTIGPDSGFGNPFASWVPKVGELVGYAVSASATSAAADEHGAGAHRCGPGPLERQLDSALQRSGDSIQALTGRFEEMATMRSCVLWAAGMLALASVASAQTPASAPAQDQGYVEGVIQSAFGNVTSQSYGAEVGFTVKRNVQVFGEVGRVRDVATASIGAAAQSIAGFLSQTQTNVAFRVKQPVTFGVAGLKFIVPTTGKLRPYVLAGGGVASVTQDVSFTVGGADVTNNLPSLGVALGTDLSGSFTKPMLVVGAGAMWPWQRLVVRSPVPVRSNFC